MPGIRNSKATRGSRMMLRRLSMRLLPRRAGTTRACEPQFCELLGGADAARLGKHAAARPDLSLEVTAQRRVALLAQRPGALLDDGGLNRRHAGGRGAGPGREREDVKVREP